MKILFFNASTNIGGIESVFFTYASGLTRMGHKVYYVSCWDNGDFDEVLPKEVHFVRLGNVRLRYSLFRLRNILKEILPDAIITANDSTLIAYFARLFLPRKIRIITSQHSYLDNSDTLFYSKYIVRYIFPRCDKIFSVSEGIATMLNTSYGIDNSLIEVINNPIDLDRIYTHVNDYQVNSNSYFVFVGRMTSVKNLKMMIDAYNYYKTQFDDYSLILIGDGPERSFVEEYSKGTKYSSSIKFIGIQSNPYPYIKNAKLLLLTSTSEAFPTVLIEAMALGVTCVSTPTKGAVDILRNGEYGYISKDCHNINDFAFTINHAVNFQCDVKKLTEYVEDRFGLSNKVNHLEKIICSNDS